MINLKKEILFTWELSDGTTYIVLPFNKEDLNDLNEHQIAFLLYLLKKNTPIYVSAAKKRELWRIGKKWKSYDIDIDELKQKGFIDFEIGSREKKTYTLLLKAGISRIKLAGNETLFSVFQKAVK